MIDVRQQGFAIPKSGNLPTKAVWDVGWIWPPRPSFSPQLSLPTLHFYILTLHSLLIQWLPSPSSSIPTPPLPLSFLLLLLPHCSLMVFCFFLLHCVQSLKCVVLLVYSIWLYYVSWLGHGGWLFFVSPYLSMVYVEWMEMSLCRYTLVLLDSERGGAFLISDGWSKYLYFSGIIEGLTPNKIGWDLMWMFLTWC